MDTINLEFSILSDEYKINTLISESNYFSTLIKTNVSINESAFGDKVKGIIKDFGGKIKEIISNIKDFFVNLKERIKQKIVNFAWKIINKWDTTAYEYDDDFDDEFFEDDEDIVENESVIYENEQKVLWFSKKTINDFVKEHEDNINNSFKNLDKIYNSVNEYNKVVDEYNNFVKSVSIGKANNMELIDLSDSEVYKKIEEKTAEIKTKSDDIYKIILSNNKENKYSSKELSNERESSKSSATDLKPETSNVSKTEIAKPKDIIKYKSEFKNIVNDALNKISTVEKVTNKWCDEMSNSIKALEAMAKQMEDIIGSATGYDIVSKQNVNLRSAIQLYNTIMRDFGRTNTNLTNVSKFIIIDFTKLATNLNFAIKVNGKFFKKKK